LFHASYEYVKENPAILEGKRASDYRTFIIDFISNHFIFGKNSSVKDSLENSLSRSTMDAKFNAKYKFEDMINGKAINFDSLKGVLDSVFD